MLKGSLLAARSIHLIDLDAGLEPATAVTIGEPVPELVLDRIEYQVTDLVGRAGFVRPFRGGDFEQEVVVEFEFIDIELFAFLELFEWDNAGHGGSSL